MSEMTGTFTIAGWDEKAYHEAGERKLTYAVVDQEFSGDITGKGNARWLMSYAPDGTAHFVGLQHVDGVVDGKKGAFVLETIGDFRDGVASWKARAVAGSGSGELEAIAGTGSFEAPHGHQASYTLDLST